MGSDTIGRKPRFDKLVRAYRAITIRMMSPRLYVIIFMILAVIFVPVLFYFFFGALVAPCCYAVVQLFVGVDPSGWRQAIWLLGHVVIYFGLFYGAARFTFWASQLASGKRAQTAIQVVILLGLFACSFLRVIEESEMRYGMSGTYDFWGACIRYAQTH
jgi:hypothetical protein